MSEAASDRAPYRHDYLRHQQLSEVLRGFAERHPELTRLESIGVTPEGRDIWMMTVGRDLDRVRPTLWVGANIHACELAGSSVALSIIEDLLELHQGRGELPEPIARRVLEVPVCVVPRIAPDGAEAVLATGRYVRSTPRDQRAQRSHPRWIRRDVDGDGLAQLMRIEDPSGTFVESVDAPGLMLPRRLEDEGPFYKIYPEGVIDNFDGHHIPDPVMLSDNQTDLNRQFAYLWEAGHVQMGAGDYPGSEPESRAILEAGSARPQLFGWIDFHCFGGVFIRPLGDKPDNKMNRSDLALFRQLGAWAEELTGYPMVSGFEEFTYQPDKPIHGDLSDWAYNHRGCVGYVVELWDLFRRIGMEKPAKFVDYYSKVDRDDLLRLAEWDRRENRGRIFQPWRRFDHPQLGQVEVGGVDFRVGIWNPPYELLDETCRQHSAMVMRVAALAPRLELDVEVDGSDGGKVEQTSLTIHVRNTGYLPTHVLESARELTHNEPIHLELELDGPVLCGGALRGELGHLDGWGRGLGAGVGLPDSLPDRGSTERRTRVIAVSGSGTVTIRAGSCRTGWLTRRIEV